MMLMSHNLIISFPVLNKAFHGSSEPGTFVWHIISSMIWSHLRFLVSPFKLAYMPYTPANSVYSGTPPLPLIHQPPSPETSFFHAVVILNMVLLFTLPESLFSRLSICYASTRPTRSSSSVIFVTPLADIPTLDWMRNPLYVHNPILSSIIMLPSANLQICLHNLLFSHILTMHFKYKAGTSWAFAWVFGR